jgi:hypothetical protein
VTSTGRTGSLRAAALRPPDTRRRTGAGLLGLLLVIFVGQRVTPEPWLVLWPLVPAIGAAALLLTQTQLPALGWLPPALALGGLVAVGAANEPWAWCLAAGCLAASLLGLAERRGAAWSARPWAFLPVLVLAALLPLAPGYARLVADAVGGVRATQAQQLSALEATQMTPEQRAEAAQLVAAGFGFLELLARTVLPAILFAWVVALVGLGERLSRRLADFVKRPLGPGAPLALWRLPDAAVWFLVLGLALVVTKDARVVPVGINLATSVGLAFALQGFAVVQVFLTSSGMTPGLVTLLFVFVALAMWPILPVGCAGVGLMDVWLDFRRLEPRPHDDEPEGGNEPWK